MQITYDPAKREATLRARGLDMAEAGAIFDGPILTVTDDRADYREIRQITIGFLAGGFLPQGSMAGRMVVLVWTARGNTRRIISMRKANDREYATYAPRFGP